MNRHLCRGKRLDNGEWETGSHVVTSQNLSNERHYIADKMTGYLTPIDPTTVEPVKMMPIEEYEYIDLSNNQMGARIVKRKLRCDCPNCKKPLSSTCEPNFCPNCGQALNWAEESAE